VQMNPVLVLELTFCKILLILSSGLSIGFQCCLFPSGDLRPKVCMYSEKKKELRLLFNSWVGVRMSPLLTSAIIGSVVPAPDDMITEQSIE
jgi:hypothetical protein